MKDKYGVTMIIEFIALRSKTYSIRDANNNEKAQATQQTFVLVKTY